MTSSTLNTPKSDFLKSMESISGNLSEETRKKVSDIFDIKAAWLQETAKSILSNSTDMESLRSDMISYMTESIRLISEAIQIVSPETQSNAKIDKVYKDILNWFFADMEKHPKLSELDLWSRKQMIQVAIDTLKVNSQKK